MRVITISHGAAPPQGLQQLEDLGCRVISKGSTGDTFCAVLSFPSTDHRLTPRQVEILQMTAEGISVTRIAEKLRVSRKTVERHLRHARQRLAVSNDVQLGVVIERLGL